MASIKKNKEDILIEHLKSLKLSEKPLCLLLGESIYFILKIKPWPWNRFKKALKAESSIGHFKQKQCKRKAQDDAFGRPEK